MTRPPHCDVITYHVTPETQASFAHSIRSAIFVFPVELLALASLLDRPDNAAGARFVALGLADPFAIFAAATRRKGVPFGGGFVIVGQRLGEHRRHLRLGFRRPNHTLRF